MKIAVLSSHTPSLFWFRIDMMREFLNNGHTVIALGTDPEAEWQEKFKEFDIEYKQLSVERNGFNPFKDFKTLAELINFINDEKPDKIFAYQAKTVIYGSIAARLNGITEVYPLIAGLGSIFRGSGLKNKIVGAILKMEYKVACSCSKKVFFQNNDDRSEFIRLGLIEAEKTVIINGSGVNLEKFKQAPLPEQPAFLLIGRLIRDKGVIEYLEACKKIKKEYPQVRCMLVGPYDTNPSAIKPEELKSYIDDGIVEYFGEQNDVRQFIAQCSTYVLPSYHEGTPKTVLEAMAMGRSIITTNAPGCRETVKNNINGYLVEVKDIKEIVEKMKYLIANPVLNLKMGKASLEIVKEKYDVKNVNQTIMNTIGLTYLEKDQQERASLRIAKKA